MNAWHFVPSEETKVLKRRHHRKYAVRQMNISPAVVFAAASDDDGDNNKIVIKGAIIRKGN